MQTQPTPTAATQHTSTLPDEQPHFRTAWERARFHISLAFNEVAVGLNPLTGWQWFNRIDKTLLLGALATPPIIHTLTTTENVKSVINMCLEHPGEGGRYPAVGIEELRLRTEDFTVPGVEDLWRGCEAGRGRSAALALCYLLYRYDLTPQQAQEILLSKRQQVNS
ncbi:Phosphatidylglycerophosphatase and protein-tyrosine phosphatase 1 [Rhizophlyctis rosea]|nr:Phosphatidylglycerophosphatase and protein-tyrosine phosphatase 1 [Rhizophlyctis rosea]